MSKLCKWTAEELEEMRKFDEMVDEMDMTEDDYKQVDFDDELLFPQKAKEVEKRKVKVARQRENYIATGRIEERREKQRKYQEENKERIKARRAAYYQANKERIAAHQKAYRERKAAEAASSK